MRSYNLTPWRAAVQLLPPKLRVPFWLGFVRTCVKPIETLTLAFSALVERSRYHLNLSGQVIYLEFYLNDLFDTAQRRIYIDDASPILPDFLYTKSEGQPLTIYTRAENQPLTLYTKQDFYGTSDFTVFIPASINTPAVLDRLRAAVNSFKPAGRRFQIELI